MHAYSQVDPTVRRKLEEMLKTWREPSPGSLSTAPVFPLASTQAIVDNLNKLRASTATPVSRYTHQVPSTSRVASTQPYRNTPTPPQIPTQPIQPLPQIFPVQYGQQVGLNDDLNSSKLTCQVCTTIALRSSIS